MSRTILLADDSVTIQKVIELTFMDEDYEVVAVGNGDDALEKLEEITPDFVIADVHMPGASGYDVAKHSKSLRPEVPVLLLVGTFEPFDDELAEKSGCDAYLKKPFDSQELQRLIEDLSAEAEKDAGPLEATGWQAQSPASPGAGSTPASSGAGSTPASPGAGSTPASPGAGSIPAEPAPAVESAASPPEPPAPSSAEGETAEHEASPFSIGLDDDEPAPTRVEPPPAQPEPEAVGSTAPPEEGPAEEPAFDLGEPTPGATQAEAPVFDELPQSLDGSTGAEAAPELPTEPEPFEPAAAAGEPETGPASRPEPEPEPVAGSEPATAAQEPPPAVEQVEPASQAVDDAPVVSSPLSDEDVDRIARRIVELLGDRAVRDVAWEVVPDMAEVVIRSRLHDLETQVETVE